MKILLALFFVSMGQAHESGHGVTITGKGPNGGKLTALVSAAEADLGDKAQTQAVLEWSRNKDTLVLHFWDKEQKKLELPAGQDMKWILLGKNLPKAEVIVDKTTSGEISRKFSPDLLAKVEKVEVILPTAQSGKLVAAFSLPK